MKQTVEKYVLHRIVVRFELQRSQTSQVESAAKPASLQNGMWGRCPAAMLGRHCRVVTSSTNKREILHLSFRAYGPRNLMKIIRGKIATARSGEVGTTMEELRPFNCLIRSVRD